MQPVSSATREFDETCQFIIALARASQRYGISAHHLESNLSRVAAALGLNAQFVVGPTYVQTILWDQHDSRQRIHFILSRGSRFNMAKLVRLGELVETIESGDRLPSEGLQRLQEIEAAENIYQPFCSALAFVCCGLGFAVILGLSWMDVAWGGLLSLGSYAIVLLVDRSPEAASLTELLAALVTSVLAGFIAIIFPGSNPLAVTACAVIYFVPGFGLTVGLNEMMVGNTLSGISWFANAVVNTLKLFGGAGIGLALVESQSQIPMGATSGSGASLAWTWFFVPVLVLGLAVLFQVRVRDIGWVLVGSWLVWAGVQLGNPIGYWQGTFVGAALLSVYSNLFFRKTGLPTAVIQLPDIMILVPGFATLRALHIAETEGLVAGLSAGFHVLVLLVAILGGVLVGNTIVPLRKSR